MQLAPLKVYKNLTKTMRTKSFKSELYRIGGGAFGTGFINVSDIKNIKQYIGSSKDLYQRFLDHYKGRDTNIRLKRSIGKYGIENFNFVIYYWDDEPAVRLTDIETKVIQSFPFENLYNFKKEASSLLGYKHTMEAIRKMNAQAKDI